MKLKLRAPAVITALMLALTLVASCSPDSVLPTETASPPPTDTLPPTEPPTQPPTVPPFDPEAHVTLNLSVFYDTYATMQYQAIDGSYYYPAAEYHAADGKTYRPGDFKPIWAALKERLNFTIKDVHPADATNVNQSFNTISANNFAGVDIAIGSATQIVEEALTGGTFVALDEYLDIMPNFSKFLDDYSVVKTSITAADGHIYYTPYFDGFDDIERMFIFRADWVRRLLDEDAAFDTDREVDTYYKPYLSESYEIDVKAVTADGGGVQTIKKKAKANIVTTQNNLEVKNGETLTTALRAHIDAVYGDTYKNRSDLFIGQDAAYDADEMVALFRCVLANTSLLTGQSERPAVPFYPRWYQAGRVHDLLGLSMAFGVRGHESKMGRLYLDKDGVLKDISLEPQYYDLIERLHWMYKEGLILKDFHISGATDGLQGGDHRARLNNENLGFATYDYNQTTTVFNSLEDVYPGFDLRPVLPPVANWDGEWHQFTSSWRSVKSDGWAILKSIEADPDKLYRALMLFDYMFSPEGGRLMSYGPEEWIDGTLKYNGKDIPRLSAAALKELNELAGGNYTNYYRRWLGGTFPIGYVKEQGQEYQVVHPKGRVGLDYILRACELGTMHHLRLNATEDTPPQETMLPTTFRVTLAEERRIREELTDFQTLWRAGSNDTDRYVYLDYILAGFSEDADNPIIGTPFPRYEIPMRTKAGLLDFVANERNGKLYLEIYADAYKRMTEEEQSNPP